MNKIIFIFLIFFITDSIFSEKRTPIKKIPLSSVYGNFKLAKGKVIEAEGEVSNILYSGNSIRFVLEKNSKNPVVIESYDPYLISGARVGAFFKLCGIFLKFREFKIKEKKTKLPVILVENSSCP